MKFRHLKYPAAIAAAVALASCGSDSTHDISASGNNPVQIAVPGISAAVTYSFDLGAIDLATGMYYVTDRTNKAVDVINLNGGAASVLNTPVRLFKQAYAGCFSGGTTGGQKNFPYIPMPGCLNIAITANQTLVTNNDLDGPDGLDIVKANLFVGDVNTLWVVNKTTGTLVGKIAIKNTGTQQGFRSDEGCYDQNNHLYATALTGDPNTPFYTILDTTAHDADPTGATMPVVIAQLLMNDNTGAPSAGLEACFFDTRGAVTGAADATAGFMWLNNDGSTANPNGEADGVPIADLLALKTAGFPRKVVFAGSAAGPFVDPGVATATAAVCALGAGGPCGAVAPKIIALPALCDATGIAAGPANGFEAGAMCRPGTFGHSLDFVIINTAGPTNTAGSVVTTLVGQGGGDQVAFDPVSNRYYLANSRATANGKSCFSGGTQACNLTPHLTVVDGTTHAVVGTFDSGNNAHSVAAGLGMVLMPFSNTSATAGGANFPNGGVALYPTM